MVEAGVFFNYTPLPGLARTGVSFVWKTPLLWVVENRGVFVDTLLLEWVEGGVSFVDTLLLGLVEGKTVYCWFSLA